MYVNKGYYNDRLYGIIGPMKISPKGDAQHALNRPFLDMRNAAANILEDTTRQDAIGRAKHAKKDASRVIPMVISSSMRGKNA